jgi:hypothetical protein
MLQKITYHAIFLERKPISHFMEKQQKQPILRTIAILGLGVIPLAACAQNAGSSSLNLSVPTFDGTSYYDSVAERVGLDSANANNIDEQFTGGKMSDTVWNALSGVWQNDSAAYPHNGMQAHNLFYVKNGSKTQLAFEGRGIYSSDSDTVIKNGYREPEGACIISKNHLGPGRYEIAMAAMPREGGVSAMWTYCTTTGSEATSQNEIDIEIGGNTSETYMREWCTTWTKHTSKATINVDVSKLCYLNDGAIHKYNVRLVHRLPGHGRKAGRLVCRWRLHRDGHRRRSERNRDAFMDWPLVPELVFGGGFRHRLSVG